MGQMPEYKRGRRDGFRLAITWLHTRASEMNDPHAKAVLNSAAFSLGVDLRDSGILSEVVTMPAAEPHSIDQH